MAHSADGSTADNSTFSFPCIASWLDRAHNQTTCLGQLTGSPSDLYLTAHFSPTKCNYKDTNVYLCLVLSPATTDAAGSPALHHCSTVALTVTREHLQADALDMGVARQKDAPQYVAQELRGRGLFRVSLALRRAPAVLMPKHPRALHSEGEYAYVMALRALSEMRLFDLWLPHADRVVWKTRRFRHGLERGAGSLAPVPETHYVLGAGADGDAWSRFRVRDGLRQGGVGLVADHGQAAAAEDGMVEAAEETGSGGLAARFLQEPMEAGQGFGRQSVGALLRREESV
ncbi:hypothetical protein MPH_12376 [Macrophomina phaseolina MS6]|uniref:Uncharacterized protein n=1 Tax=Macrophomina phaseolina (strain MS6) TaxID=1126212 RepID=K2R828_MACPH|nr:hypothetical protein MPH_12376 [Macrophomina phaseolina MS6]